VVFIEARSSSPKPGNGQDLDSYINEISCKFSHSIDIFFSVIVKRLEDTRNEMPIRFKNKSYEKMDMKLILVINGHEIEWLLPITDGLKKKLKRKIKTWKLELIVLNDKQAFDWGLLTS